MRFMVIVKANKDSEAGIMPSTEEFAAMGKFNEELVKAGMMEAGEGLHPSSKGARIKSYGGEFRGARTVKPQLPRETARRVRIGPLSSAVAKRNGGRHCCQPPLRRAKDLPVFVT